MTGWKLRPNGLNPPRPRLPAVSGPEVVRRRLEMVVNAYKCVLLRTNAYIPTGQNSRNVNKIK